MSTHRLVATQVVPRPLPEVFDFFATPDNLARITPSAMGFEFLTEDRAMRSGLLIDYKLRPLPFLPVSWRTRIDAYDPPNGFEDVQLRGPYRRWEHRHAFQAVDDGTLVTDEIEYELPFGPLGDLVNRLVVRRELEHIFRYRAAVIATALQVPDARPDGAPPMTVAVAGGTGFVGGGIAAELHRRGHRVVVLSHRGESARGPLPDDIEIRRADVADAATLEPALAGVDALVIALAFPNSPMEAPRKGFTFEEVDARGTERLAAAARAAGVGRLVYISGAGAAPDADRHWFRAKWRAEEAIRESGITSTIIRPTWIYGPRDVSLNRFLAFARRLPVVPLTNTGGQSLAPVFIDDVGRLAADSLDGSGGRRPGLRAGRARDDDDARDRPPGDPRGRCLAADPARTDTAPQARGLAALVPADTAPHPRGDRLHQPAGDGRPRAAARAHAAPPDPTGRGAVDLSRQRPAGPAQPVVRRASGGWPIADDGIRG